MNTAFEKLRELVPPPSEPYEAQGDWEAVEAQVGSSLPEDYKAFISAYGTGLLCKVFYVFNPFAKSRNLNFFKRGEEIFDTYRTLLEAEYPLEIPYKLFPEPGGLLPWGWTDHNYDLFWVTKGAPHQWHVFCCESRDNEWCTFEGESACSFMEGLISKRIKSRAFRRRWFSKKPNFKTITRNPEDELPKCVVSGRTAEHTTYTIGGKFSLEMPTCWQLREPTPGRNEILSVTPVDRRPQAELADRAAEGLPGRPLWLTVRMKKGTEGKRAEQIADDDLAYCRRRFEGFEDKSDPQHYLFRVLDKGFLESESGPVPYFHFEQNRTLESRFHWLQGELVYELFATAGAWDLDHWRPEFEAVASSVRLLG